MTSRFDDDLFASIERGMVQWYLGLDLAPLASRTAVVRLHLSEPEEQNRMSYSLPPYPTYLSTRFYTVWREGGASPTKQHPSYEAATKEAERLSQLTPGVRFFVMSATTMKFTPKPIAQKTETVHL